jgi:hypothetical protein
MAIIKREDIAGVLDASGKFICPACNEAMADGERNEFDEDHQIITRQEIYANDDLYICDECGVHV